MSVSTDLLVCSLCRCNRQSRGVEVPRDRRLCRFVKFIVQTDGCQEGAPSQFFDTGPSFHLQDVWSLREVGLVF